MKKIVGTVFVLLFFCSLPLSIVAMDPALDKYTLVSFRADDGIVHIEKKNIPLIGALYERYDIYQKSKYKRQQIVIPLLKGYLKEEITLVNNALNIRPDHFVPYFNALPENHKDKILKSSMLHSNGSKKVGLHVPEITKRLLSFYLNKDSYNNVMKFFPHTEKNDLMLHCASRLIENKSSIGIVKQPISMALFPFKEIDLQTLFINGSFDSDCVKRPISLRINDTTYATYAYNFVGPHLECRVTEDLSKPYSSDYLLWIIYHNNPEGTFSTSIKHSGPIIGCCFSKTKTNIEYVITYSEKDINFSTMSMFEDGFYDVKTVCVDTTSNGKNIAAAYWNTNNQLIMGMYEGINNVFINWAMDGTPSQPILYPFKRCGLLEKIIITKNHLYQEEAFFIFGSCFDYDVQRFQDLGNNSWTGSGRTGMHSIDSINGNYFVGTFFKRDDEIFRCDYSSCSSSPFAAIEKEARRNQQLSLFQWSTQGFMDDFNDDECHKKYSSSGEFILCNSLIKKMGMLYVKTQIFDYMTHTPLFSTDTLYKNFNGVGFDEQEKRLIFLQVIGGRQVLLWDEQDKKNMQLFEQAFLKDLGTQSLMARLLEEIKKNKIIVLKESDPICSMLRDWIKTSPDRLEFMNKCFPLRVIKA